MFSPKGEGTYAGTGFLASLFPVDAPEFLRESGGLGVTLPFEFAFELGYAEGGGGDTGPYREFVFCGTVIDGGLPARIFPIESTDRLGNTSDWE